MNSFPIWVSASEFQIASPLLHGNPAQNMLFNLCKNYLNELSPNTKEIGLNHEFLNSSITKTVEATPKTMIQSNESSFVVFNKSPTIVLNIGIVASEK